MIIMLGDQVEPWETLLAAMKLGTVIIPATPLLEPADLRARIDRGAATHVVVSAGDAEKAPRPSRSSWSTPTRPTRGARARRAGQAEDRLEGTDTVQSLVVGRAVTGLATFA